MTKKQVIIIASAVVVLGLAGWGGYKYFSTRSDTVTTQAATTTTVESFARHSAWVYHEYVYRVDFSDSALRPFLFVQNADGTFSPSQADSSGNILTGNGFIADSTGAMMLTDMMAEPWNRGNMDQSLLKSMIDDWLSTQDFVANKNYRISGQTVALFAVLSDPAAFIEYNTTQAVPGQEGYTLAYPAQRISLMGMGNATPLFSPLPTGTRSANLRIVKTVMDGGLTGSANRATTLIDSVAADLDNTGSITKLNAFKGDGFFYEGSAVFDTLGNFVGQLHYNINKWQLAPVRGFVANPPVYRDYEVKESWGYVDSTGVWVRRSKIIE